MRRILVKDRHRQSSQFYAAPSNTGSGARRMPQEGMLVQIDGSNHPWLEDRGPKLGLLIAVDDATGVVAGGRFPHHRVDSRGYLVLLEWLVRSLP